MPQSASVVAGRMPKIIACGHPSLWLGRTGATLRRPVGGDGLVVCAESASYGRCAGCGQGTAGWVCAYRPAGRVASVKSLGLPGNEELDG